MKNNKLLIIVTLVVILLSISALFFINNRGELDSVNEQSKIENEIKNDLDSSDFIVAHSQLSNLPIEELSDLEKEGLIMMREEEKLAHDVYSYLYEKWGLNIFNNIAKSELTHTESVRYLIERYGLEDPVQSMERGVFSNSVYSDLYSKLTLEGAKSLESALMVGATIEDLDISDLNKLSLQVDNKDILEIYSSLTRGSRNHLRSFSKQLENRSQHYSAQYLTQDEVDGILSSNQERGF